MSNLNDYLLWRGDIPVKEYSKLNEIDNLILARFSYLIFNKINMDEKETIETISKKMKDFKNEEFRYNGDKDMIKNLGESTRFKDMQVTDYIENKDKKVEKQFSAITIHISPDELYVSYIGTDSSIVGWKEDLNMAFMDSVPAQIEGKKYLELIANKYPNKRIRIGGHSKGGNVAIFSAIAVNKQIQNRIVGVYNYDGPGLSQEVTDKIENKDIIKKIHTFIPQDSVIGRLLEHKEKCKIVLSTEKGIYQHDVFSWQVLGAKMVTVDNVTQNSELINKTIATWLKQTTPQQRQIFIDGLFELFYSTNANEFKEIQESLSTNIPKVIKTYMEIPEEDRKIMTSMLKEFGKAYTETIKQSDVLKIHKKEK